MNPSITELSLLDRWQRDFPLVDRPFAVAGQAVGLDETATIDMFRRLQVAGMMSRIGAAVRPQTIGASTLAAMQVPPDRLETVAAIVSSEVCVNHNYERTHQFNLWFVVAAPDSAAVSATIARIEQRTGFAVMSLPLVEAFHIDLGFSLDKQGSERAGRRQPAMDYRPDDLDRELLAAIENGLPIIAQPYREVADQLDLSEDSLLARLQQLIGAGIVSRFGCIVRHRALGYTANAMAVWDIPDDMLGTIASVAAADRNVSLCYRRERRPPDWPFNLFCMIHARTREEALEAIDCLNWKAKSGSLPHDILFSTRCFKQRGAKFSRAEGAVH